MQPATLELEFGAELRRPQAPSVSEFGAVVAKSSLPPWSWELELSCGEWLRLPACVPSAELVRLPGVLERACRLSAVDISHEIARFK